MSEIARWCFRHRFTVITIWIATLVAVAVPYLMLGSGYNNAFDLPGTESTKAQSLLRAHTPAQAGDSDQIVIHTRHGSVRDPAVRRKVAPMLTEVAALPSVASVQSMYGADGAARISPDGATAYATVTFDAQGDQVPVADTERVIRTARSVAGPDVRVELGGVAVTDATGTSAPSTEYIGILAAGVILFVAFGTLLGMIVPLLVAVAGVGTGMITVGLLSRVTTIGTIAPTVAALIGLGVGIDYALFIVTRHRGGLRDGLPPQDAAVRALNTSGRAVLFAGGTVVAALLGMLVLGITPLTGIGIAAATTVLFTVLAAVTLLPALLGVFGGRLITRRERRRLAATGPRTAPAGDGFWGRWADFVARRKAVLSAVALLVIAVLSLPALSLRLGAADAGNDPAGTTTRQAYDLLADGFGPGSNGPLVLVTPLHGPADAAALGGLAATIRHTPGVASVRTAPVTAATTLGVIDVVPTGAPQDRATGDLLGHLRRDVIPAAEKNTGLEVHVGGATATSDDFSHVLTGKLPLFLTIILAFGCLLLMIAFRSVVIPLTAAVMNLLASAASFGVVVAVFQWGAGSELLGAGKAGPVESILPVIMLAILFGLSMDYQVFLVSRMHEDWLRTKDNHHAVRAGQAGTGRMITAAALIMICVFMAFVFGGQRTIAEFGVGLATAVGIDAFVLRTVLVPALMHLFGNANWWLPAWLDRILPRLTIEGAPTPAPARAVAAAPAADRALTLAPARKLKKDAHTQPRPKSLATAYVWWFFLGLFGAHHFYLGRSRLGLLHLGTAGICGLGWLVDPFLLPRQVRAVNGRLPAAPPHQQGPRIPTPAG
ncbi:MMPL family transporter [Streptomyces sp. NRRL F-5126]|uniref:MMPL family transporter n=1 Tax=Streptomyces sp. NRRL F-5126 TaxID=1463857 RepID=UPI000AF19C79|nr:MMPL family transporter [Streptomyces sp. NRRL F-5126]